jgi:uncharacterized protein (TIGR03435 family)
LQEQPVLALVIGKGGSKLKPSTEKPVALDESEPLKDGETQKDTPDGPIRLLKNADGSTTYNMGVRGTFTLKFDDESSCRCTCSPSSIDHEGLRHDDDHAGRRRGSPDGRHDGLTGNYQAAADFSLMDLMSSLHESGDQFPTRPGSGGGSGEATDPEGGATVSAALEKLGLKLEKSRAKVGRLVVDHVEKTPGGGYDSRGEDRGALRRDGLERRGAQ